MFLNAEDVEKWALTASAALVVALSVVIAASVFEPAERRPAPSQDDATERRLIDFLPATPRAAVRSTEGPEGGAPPFASEEEDDPEDPPEVTAPAPSSPRPAHAADAGDAQPAARATDILSRPRADTTPARSET